MLVICPECAHERQIDTVFFAGPRFEIACSRCASRFHVETRTAAVSTISSRLASPPQAPTSAPPPSSAERVHTRIPTVPRDEDLAALREEVAERYERIQKLAPHAVLEVPQSATPSEVQRAYLQLCARYWPGHYADRLDRESLERMSAISSRLDEALHEIEDRRRGASGPPPRDPVCDVRADAARAEKALRAGRLEEATELFRRCVTFEPEDSKHHYRLGVCLLRIGAGTGGDESDTLTEAQHHLHKALALAPEEPPILMALGDVAARLGRSTVAQRYYQKVLEHDAGNHAAERALRLLRTRDKSGRGGTTVKRLLSLIGRG